MSFIVKNLHVSFGSSKILKDISFSINERECVGILGPNGCGKSTLLRTLSGIIKPQSGVVKFKNNQLHSIKRSIRAKEIGFLSQSDVIPIMTTVRDYVALGRHPHRNYFRNGSIKDNEIIDAAIEQCEIAHLKDRTIEHLSGGERQRVRIATLLSQCSSTILLDEPFTGLDLEHQYSLLSLLKSLNDNGKTIIVVLHDLALAMRFFNRLMIMKDGNLVADGVPSKIISKSLLESVFRIKASIGCDNISGDPVVSCSIGGLPGCASCLVE